MFTGLVESIGVLRRRAGGPVARALIETSLPELVLGESVNVNGACLTVDKLAERGFFCDMSSETLGRTTLGRLPLGARVHLERATPLGGRMGGHVVLGHVDGIGRVTALARSGDALRLSARVHGELARYLAPKGSIALDGVSLTLNGVEAPGGAEVGFDVMLVPHTLGRTQLGELRAGSEMNVEIDVLARYVGRQLEAAGLAAGPSRGTMSGDHDGGGETERPDDDERLLAKLRTGGYL